VPEADAAEQQQPADFPDETDLDSSYPTTTDREANEADLIEQAIEVPVPDDEWDADY
jgi:hypothetical protein